MPTVPQTVLDSLSKLTGDSDSLKTSYATQAQREAELAAAKHAKEVADQDVQTGVSNLESDKASLIELIKTAFPSAPPAVVPTPDPVPPAPAG